MNYAKAQPNGPLTVADQIKFLRINAGTRLIGAPDREQDKKAANIAIQCRTCDNYLNKKEERIALKLKGYSVLTVNRNRTKKNHRN